MKMFITGKVLLKGFFILSLFTTFLYNFGIPAMKEYLKEEVFVKISKDSSTDGTVPAPAITVCAINPETGLGWKSESTAQSTKNGFVGCDGLDGKKFIDCVNTLAYDIEDIVVTIPDSQEYTTAEIVSTDITLAAAGKCHTFSQERMSSEAGNLELPPLNKSLDYRIFIHDPDFFFISTNPKVYPGFKEYLPKQDENSSDLYYIQNIEIIQHDNLNLEKSLCVENTEYDFSMCLKNAVNKGGYSN